LIKQIIDVPIFIISFITTLPILFDVILVLYHQIKINGVSKYITQFVSKINLYICPENINELTVIDNESIKEYINLSEYISLLFGFLSALICYITILADYNTDKTNSNLYLLLLYATFLSICCFYTNDLL